MATTSIGYAICGFQTAVFRFTYYPIPDHDPLSYAVLDHRKVVVDRETHRIVKVFP